MIDTLIMNIKSSITLTASFFSLATLSHMEHKLSLYQLTTTTQSNMVKSLNHIICRAAEPPNFYTIITIHVDMAQEISRNSKEV